MSTRRYPCIVSLLCLLLATPAYAESDAMSALHLVRQAGCEGRQAVGTLLAHRPELDAAARALSQRATLREAIAESGYLAKTVQSIYLRNAMGSAAIASVLSRRYCDVMLDTNLEDAGTYSDGTETWIVLAKGLISEAANEPDTATATLLGLVNDARAEARQCGRQFFRSAPPLRRVAELDVAAGRQAADMASEGRLTHRGADGSMPGERVTRTGYRWAAVGENVAADQTEPSAVVATWLASTPHCSALMDASFSETGLALASGEAHGSGIYWVQVYSSPR